MESKVDASTIDAILARRIEHSQWPTVSAEEDPVRALFERTAEALNRYNEIEVTSTYRWPPEESSSYAKIFCTKPNNGSVHEIPEGKVVAGIGVVLSRYTPIAVWGVMTKTFDPDWKYAYESELSFDRVYSPPQTDDWSVETRIVSRTLERLGWLLPSAEYLRGEYPNTLPFKSILAHEKPRNFDAIFWATQ